MTTGERTVYVVYNIRVVLVSADKYFGRNVCLHPCVLPFPVVDPLVLLRVFLLLGCGSRVVTYILHSNSEGSGSVCCPASVYAYV